jgi:hypothetical protein
MAPCREFLSDRLHQAAQGSGLAYWLQSLCDSVQKRKATHVHGSLVERSMESKPFGALGYDLSNVCDTVIFCRQ